ncbi:cbb3-type cytochrome oxidase maturation protein [Aquamicrobium ahrensii]|uniref:Cbb3-type cytochrome oxidase maturation protein n=1 Tax=Aquamicrobium ahrensii TaxID=469551 RepID=A0ABV2KPH8_9HYPH
MTGSLIYLVPLALALGGVALGAFLWSLKSGQYDDLDGAAERIFIDDEGDRIGGGQASSADESREAGGKRG